MTTEEDLDCSLFTIEQKDYGELYCQHCIEQYKLYIEMADRVSARRQAANSFFVTLNTTLTGLLGYIHLSLKGDTAYFWVIPISGLAVCYMWYRQILSYRQLNQVKFKVINKIETRLPIAPFDAEWDLLTRRRKPGEYLPLTQIERFIPWVFFGLHLLALASLLL